MRSICKGLVTFVIILIALVVSVGSPASFTIQPASATTCPQPAPVVMMLEPTGDKGKEKKIRYDVDAGHDPGGGLITSLLQVDACTTQINDYCTGKKIGAITEIETAKRFGSTFATTMTHDIAGPPDITLPGFGAQLDQCSQFDLQMTTFADDVQFGLGT